MVESGPVAAEIGTQAQQTGLLGDTVHPRAIAPSADDPGHVGAMPFDPAGVIIQVSIRIIPGSLVREEIPAADHAATEFRMLRVQT